MTLRPAHSVTLAGQLFGKDPARTLALVRAAWTRAVGPELARRTEAVTLEGTTLRVRVPDARWRKVLHRMQPELLRRLRTLAGELAPRSLGFMEGPVAGASDPAPALPDAAATAPPPAASVVEAARAIDDIEVRRAFLETAGRYLARGLDKSGTEKKGR
jgi:hypothetical protein